MYGHVYMQLRPPQIVKNAQSFPSHPPLQHRAIIYTTKMSKQMTKSDVRDAVHMYPVT
jgi:hypothetical protein